MATSFVHILPDARFADDFISTLSSLFGEQSHHQFFSKTAGPLQKVTYNAGKLTPLPADDYEVQKWMESLSADTELVVHYLDARTGHCLLQSDLKASLGWVFWGADFYSSCDEQDYILPKTRSIFPLPIGQRVPAFAKKPILRKLDHWYYRTIKLRQRQKLLQGILRKLTHIYHYNSFEIDLIRRTYKTTANQVPFMYPRFFTVSTFDQQKVDSQSDQHSADTITILLGNSASPYLNHLDGLDLIPAEDKVHVTVPLSYGNPAYTESLHKNLKNYNGPDLSVLDQYLAAEDYYNLLSRMHLYLSPSIRSIGMGNITTMLALGKSVVLFPNNPGSAYLKECGFHIEDLHHDLSVSSLERFALQVPHTANQELAHKLFSKEAIERNYTSIFASY